jgi:predicted O-linked N-acetylglucosamine transferase (SPINDLY family)
MTLEDALQRALQEYQTGRLAAAEHLCRQVLAQWPRQPGALHLLGVLAYRQGQVPSAIALIQEAVALQPQNVEAWSNLGAALHSAGRPDEAVAAYQKALDLDPRHADAHNNLGAILAGRSRFGEAIAAYQRALALNPVHVDAQYNLGNALQALGRFDEAIVAYQHALALRPEHPECHVGLGNIALARGKMEEAIAAFRQALALRPTYAGAWYNLGNALKDNGQLDQAVAAYRRAIELRPGFADAFNNLGVALQDWGRFDEAVDAYRQAVQIDPEKLSAYLSPAGLLADMGLLEKARELYGSALRLQPSPRVRLLAAVVLPPVYRSVDQIERCRADLIDGLRRLDEEGVRLDPTQEEAPPLFYLAYHGRNERELQTALARLTQGPRALDLGPGPRTGGSRIHVGFLSAHFRDHTIGRLNAGTIGQLNRKVFEVTVLSAGPANDELGQAIRRSADHYLMLPRSIPEALRTIAAQGLDVLFFTDLGMDPATWTLAHSRLAPVQCVTWGHPLTTGLPTMDYFISSQDLEVEGADAHYTEKLVRLSTLAVSYTRPRPPPARARAFFGLDEEAHLYGCPQSLFKLHPEFDAVFGAILRQDPRGQLVLLADCYPSRRAILQERFSETLADVRDCIRFVPRQNHTDYLALIAACDVLLDPIHFGGGNTTYEALALGVPVVTLPSQLLRGRISYALYRKIGVLDAVVHTIDEYIRLVVALGTDPDRRAALSRRILAASDMLFEDVAGVRQLEQLFQSVVHL